MVLEKEFMACWWLMGHVVPPHIGQPKPHDSSQGLPGMAHSGREPNCNNDYIPVANINVVQLQPCAMSSRRWIVGYFKGMYCGRMTSTQRSESQNKVLKDGYVKRVQACTCLLKGCWTHFNMQTTWMPARTLRPGKLGKIY